jgi:hypothetical protein
MQKGRNASIEFYIKQLDLENVWSLAMQIERAKGSRVGIAACWVEAVLIELNKKYLLMKFKGD